MNIRSTLCPCITVSVDHLLANGYPNSSIWTNRSIASFDIFDRDRCFVFDIVYSSMYPKHAFEDSELPVIDHDGLSFAFIIAFVL